MTDQPAHRAGTWSGSSPDDEAWGPATPVRAGTARPRRAVVKPPKVPARPAQPAADDGWSPAGPIARRGPRSANGAAADPFAAPAADGYAASYARSSAATPERGLRWWVALLLLIAIAAVGGLIDTLGSSQVRGGFNVGIVVASVVAILLVRRSHMFPIVIAPPIVYSAAAVLQLYLRSGGLHDKRVVFDAAANYLVYGFPAIASATAAVLIIAGIRLIARR